LAPRLADCLDKRYAVHESATHGYLSRYGSRTRDSQPHPLEIWASLHPRPSPTMIHKHNNSLISGLTSHSSSFCESGIIGCLPAVVATDRCDGGSRLYELTDRILLVQLEMKFCGRHSGRIAVPQRWFSGPELRKRGQNQQSRKGSPPSFVALPHLSTLSNLIMLQ
jgi:hypothetical protein